MSDPIEIAAKALNRVYCDSDAEADERWADVDVCRHNCFVDARAVIAALEGSEWKLVRREPTGAMIGAMNSAGFKATWRSVSTDVYQAAFDSAPTFTPPAEERK